jgi:hypothetical protein
VMAPTYTMGLHDVDTSTKWTTSDVMCYFVSESPPSPRARVHCTHTVYLCNIEPVQKGTPPAARLLSGCTKRAAGAGNICQQHQVHLSLNQTARLKQIARCRTAGVGSYSTQL